MYPPAVGATSGLIILDKQEGQKEGAESTSHSLLSRANSSAPSTFILIFCSPHHSWAPLVWTTAGPLPSIPECGILINNKDISKGKDIAVLQPKCMNLNVFP